MEASATLTVPSMFSDAAGGVGLIKQGRTDIKDALIIAGSRGLGLGLVTE